MEKEINKNEKIVDVLKRLENSNSSTEKDSQIMTYLLRKIGFPNAYVTCGVVYLDGRGTIENPPSSIHSYVKALLKSNNLEG